MRVRDLIKLTTVRGVERRIRTGRPCAGIRQDLHVLPDVDGPCVDRIDAAAGAAEVVHVDLVQIADLRSDERRRVCERGAFDRRSGRPVASEYGAIEIERRHVPLEHPVEALEPGIEPSRPSWPDLPSRATHGAGQACAAP